MNKAVKQETFEAGFGASDSLLEGLGGIGVLVRRALEFHRDVIERGIASDDGFNQGNEEFFGAKIRADTLNK